MFYSFFMPFVDLHDTLFPKFTNSISNGQNSIILFKGF